MALSDFEPFDGTKKMVCDLGGGFSIRSAPERLFGVHYAIYRNVNAEFDEFLDYGADLAGC